MKLFLINMLQFLSLRVCGELKFSTPIVTVTFTTFLILTIVIEQELWKPVNIIQLYGMA